MLAPRIKLKKCAVRTCRTPFMPTRPFMTWCSSDCALAIIEAKRAKEAALMEKRERQAVKERLIELKPLQYWLKRAERAVNAYILERDREQPCISCGTWDASEWHAGHFLSVGASSASRYDPNNIHRQCSQDNVFRGGNQTNYEIGLTARIGLEAVARLKTAPRSRAWTRTELMEIESSHKLKLKRLRDER